MTEGHKSLCFWTCKRVQLTAAEFYCLICFIDFPEKPHFKCGVSNGGLMVFKHGQRGRGEKWAKKPEEGRGHLDESWGWGWNQEEMRMGRRVGTFAQLFPIWVCVGVWSICALMLEELNRGSARWTHKHTNGRFRLLASYNQSSLVLLRAKERRMGFLTFEVSASEQKVLWHRELLRGFLFKLAKCSNTHRISCFLSLSSPTVHKGRWRSPKLSTSDSRCATFTRLDPQMW